MCFQNRFHVYCVFEQLLFQGNDDFNVLEYFCQVVVAVVVVVVVVAVVAVVAVVVVVAVVAVVVNESRTCWSKEAFQFYKTPKLSKTS